MVLAYALPWTDHYIRKLQNWKCMLNRSAFVLFALGTFTLLKAQTSDVVVFSDAGEKFTGDRRGCEE